MKISIKKIFIFRLLIVSITLVISLVAADYILGKYVMWDSHKIDSICKDFAMDKFAESRGFSLVNAFYKPFDRVTHCGLEFNYTYHIDKNGFRYDKDDKKRKNILTIGDSFTFGFGVKDNENFASLLHAYNAGMWGNPFDVQFASLKRNIPLIKPKVIIWGIYPSHIVTMMPHEWSDWCPGDMKYPINAPHSVISGFDNSGIASYLKKNTSLKSIESKDNALYILKNCYMTKEVLLYDENLGGNRYTYNEAVNKTFLKDRDRVYRQLQSYMIQAKKIADKNDAKLYFVLIPSRMQLRLQEGSYSVTYPESKINANLPTETITKMIVKAGYEKDSIIDLGTAFSGQPEWREYYFVTDAHWNAKGHKFVAERIKNILKREEDK
ncbi:MAG: hypothetical protein AAB553_00335 [Patescibacteria group bacterium]